METNESAIEAVYNWLGIDKAWIRHIIEVGGKCGCWYGGDICGECEAWEIEQKKRWPRDGK